MTPLTIVRLVLLVIGVGLFTYSLRAEIEWPRLVAIGVLAIAILIRIVERFRNKRP